MTANRTLTCTLEIFTSVPLAYVAVPFGLFIICENVLGMITIWRTPALHTNANRFIFSLAITDVNVAFASIIGSCFKLPEVMVLISDSDAVDRFLIGNSMTMILLSCVHMATIAVDRYVCITKPLYYIKNATKKRVLITIYCIWIIGLTYHLAPFMSDPDEYSDKCVFVKPALEWFFPVMIVYPVTLVIVSICYVKITCVAIRHKRAAKVRRLNQTDHHGAILTRHTRVAVMKSVKFFAVVFGVFFFCTALPGIAVTVYLFGELPWSAMRVIVYLFAINSGLNFPVYTYMSKDFSKALKKTLSEISKCCCKEKFEI